jgi:hypothetical protein
MFQHVNFLKTVKVAVHAVCTLPCASFIEKKSLENLKSSKFYICTRYFATMPKSDTICGQVPLNGQSQVTFDTIYHPRPPLPRSQSRPPRSQSRPPRSQSRPPRSQSRPRSRPSRGRSFDAACAAGAAVIAAAVSSGNAIAPVLDPGSVHFQYKW